MERLPVPAKVRFRIVYEKEVDPEIREGGIVRLSEKTAVLKTDVKLSSHDNLMIDIGGDLYAKVLSSGHDGSKIIFTAKPKRFDEWMRECMNQDR